MVAIDLIDSDFDMAAALREAQRVRDLPDEPIPADIPNDRLVARARRCAVYRFFDEDGRLLYVGKAIDPDARRKQHEKRIWWSDVHRQEVEWFANERLALDAEDTAIRDENPVYNRVGGGRS
ncbi:GIY-YIG nuclease family protein [Microbacterium sp. CSI-V]|uniref:GIY-YIG nuclease family protein n=1 Tax=Microbacterium sp. CSI-V TaxID=1933777 RepID=UPI00158A97BB|nr:GIY-YIG nuclease family protein [Microbacterium sp. CSI-V]